MNSINVIRPQLSCYLVLFVGYCISVAALDEAHKQLQDQLQAVPSSDRNVDYRGLWIAAGIRDQELQKQVDARPTLDTKIQYLTSLLPREGKLLPAAEAQKDAALRLLGKVVTEAGVTNQATTNVIRLLVTNITYIDPQKRYSPASHALQVIGDRALPELLKTLEDAPDPVVKGSPEEEKIFWTAVTISAIKMSKFKEFLATQKDRLPSKVVDLLERYAPVINPGQ
jgi:hypothetical protein